MAAKKKRAPRPRTPSEEAAQKPLNGVLVQLAEGENGDREMTIQALGEVRITELPTLLGIAKKQAERELGID